MWKRLVCKLIGHSCDPMDPWYCRCFRCDHKWEYGDDVRDDLGFFLSYYNWRGRLRVRAVQEWLRCPDCKVRFGRHDHDNCFPF